MALVPMAFDKGLADWSSVTLPYTATEDGYVYAYLNPSTVNGATMRLVVGSVFLALSAHNGEGVSGCMPIKKGASVQSSALSGGTLMVYFLKAK